MVAVATVLYVLKRRFSYEPQSERLKTGATGLGRSSAVMLTALDKRKKRKLRRVIIQIKDR